MWGILEIWNYEQPPNNEPEIISFNDALDKAQHLNYLPMNFKPDLKVSRREFFDDRVRHIALIFKVGSSCWPST